MNAKMYVQGSDGFKVYNHRHLYERFILKVSLYWLCFV